MCFRRYRESKRHVQAVNKFLFPYNETYLRVYERMVHGTSNAITFRAMGMVYVGFLNLVRKGGEPLELSYRQKKILL